MTQDNVSAKKFGPKVLFKRISWANYTEKKSHDMPNESKQAKKLLHLNPCGAKIEVFNIIAFLFSTYSQV